MIGILVLPVSRRGWISGLLTRNGPGALLTLDDLRPGMRGRTLRRIRSRCRSAYLGDHTALCRVLGRYKMFVDTADIDLSSHLMLDGYWEMWVVEQMLDLVRPGMVVADAGANLGYFTLLMGELVGAAGHVHAFEPNPSLARLLDRNVALSGFAGWTTVHRVGLSDRAGEGALVVPPFQPKNGHCVDDLGRSDAVPIRLDRMDAIAGLDRVDFIKSDVEGAEERLWDGMAGVLAAGRPLTILLEFTVARYADPAAFLRRILDHGFTLRHLTLNRGLQPLDPAALLAMDRDQDQMILLSR